MYFSWGILWLLIRAGLLTLPCLAAGYFLKEFFHPYKLAMTAAIMGVVTVLGFFIMVWTNDDDGHPPPKAVSVIGKGIYLISMMYCMALFMQLDLLSQKILYALVVAETVFAAKIYFDINFLSVR